MDKPGDHPTIPAAETGQTTAAPKSVAIVRSALRKSPSIIWIVVAIIAYLGGLVSGYGLWGQPAPYGEQGDQQPAAAEMNQLVDQINPAEGYTLPVSLSDLGSRMVAGGVVDRDRFIQIYEEAGQPLTRDHMAMLDSAHTGSVVMNRENSYFLLNFFWALGLSNSNPILDEGPIQQNSENGIESFASTGGWTLATRPIGAIFSGLNLISLTDEQQARVEEAAAAVYRPCCDNPTHFPDCNHGMAMLGLLELMSAQNVSLDEMLEAARFVNAFWYPQQTLEQAVYFQKAEGTAFQDVDARLLLGPLVSSGSGFARLHQFLGEKGWLPPAPDGSGGCSV